MKKASDFARLCNSGSPQPCRLHPQNPNDPVFKETVAALREVVQHCKANGQIFLYETGQESPITLLRTIREVGFDNQFVNLDTANLILYGKGNPNDALDVVGSWCAEFMPRMACFRPIPGAWEKKCRSGRAR